MQTHNEEYTLKGKWWHWQPQSYLGWEPWAPYTNNLVYFPLMPAWSLINPSSPISLLYKLQGPQVRHRIRLTDHNGDHMTEGCWQGNPKVRTTCRYFWILNICYEHSHNTTALVVWSHNLLKGNRLDDPCYHFLPVPKLFRLHTHLQKFLSLGWI